MSLRSIPGTGERPMYEVVCNGPGCTVTLPTSERWPVLAWYEAVLRHDWVGSDDDTRRSVFRRLGWSGVFCPGCAAHAALIRSIEEP